MLFLILSLAKFYANLSTSCQLKYIGVREQVMGKPKKRTSHRRTGSRRSHLRLKLARAVNAKSPVKVYTTRREAGKVVKTATTPKS